MMLLLGDLHDHGADDAGRGGRLATEGRGAADQSKSGVTITVTRDGTIAVDDGTPMSYAEFRAAFQTLAKDRAAQGVYVRADQRVDYGLVVQVLAVVKAAGVQDVGLVAEQEQVP